MLPSLPEILLILVVGIISGFLNTVGGGGSLITLPMLIFLGLPSAVANGTNRVAIFVQSISSAVNFKRKGYFDYKLGLMLALPAMAGSIAGSFAAIRIDDALFNKLLAVIMFLVLFLLIKNPKFTGAKAADCIEDLTAARKITLVLIFFFVGFYGGFLQAGIGFIMIAALSFLTSMSLVKINSLKILVVLFYMFTSLVVFISQGKVDWILGLTLSVGSAIGAWQGSNFAVAKGDRWIRIFLIIVVSIMAAKLLGVFSFLGI